MVQFDDAKVTAYQPKVEKDRENGTGEEFYKMEFKGELKAENGMQISELFGSFRKQLIQVNFSAYDDFETGDVRFQDVHLDDFTVKTKMERIGKGKDAERIPVEFVKYTMSVKLDEEGDMLKKMFSVFHKTVKMTIE